jgi:dTMP kinase
MIGRDSHYAVRCQRVILGANVGTTALAIEAARVSTPRGVLLHDGSPYLPDREAHIRRGHFITFEGGEGTGKSTQAKLLVDRLKSRGLDVLSTREPGGSPGAEAVRHVLLSGAAKPLGPYAEAILFAAARDDHVRCTIRPALEQGTWVVSDRFADSTRVYQGALSNIDPKLIRRLEHITTGDTRPELTFILDLPAEIGLQRAAKRRGSGGCDRFEAEGLAFHNKLREAYLDLAEQEPQRCTVIDASAEMTAIADVIWASVNARFNPIEAAPPALEGAVS